MPSKILERPSRKEPRIGKTLYPRPCRSREIERLAFPAIAASLEELWEAFLPVPTPICRRPFAIAFPAFINRLIQVNPNCIVFSVIENMHDCRSALYGLTHREPPCTPSHLTRAPIESAREQFPIGAADGAIVQVDQARTSSQSLHDHCDSGLHCWLHFKMRSSAHQ